MLQDAGSRNGNARSSTRSNVFDASIKDVVFMGDHYEYNIEVQGVNLIAHSPHLIATGHVEAVIDPEACLIM